MSPPAPLLTKAATDRGGGWVPPRDPKVWGKELEQHVGWKHAVQTASYLTQKEKDGDSGQASDTKPRVTRRDTTEEKEELGRGCVAYRPLRGKQSSSPPLPEWSLCTHSQCRALVGGSLTGDAACLLGLSLMVGPVGAAGLSPGAPPAPLIHLHAPYGLGRDTSSTPRLPGPEHRLSGPSSPSRSCLLGGRVASSDGAQLGDAASKCHLGSLCGASQASRSPLTRLVGPARWVPAGVALGAGVAWVWLSWAVTPVGTLCPWATRLLSLPVT